MCLTHTILDDPDISKPSSSGRGGEEQVGARHFCQSLLDSEIDLQRRVRFRAFEGPDPTLAGFLVIPKGSEVDFQVPPVGILGIPWNIQNR